MSELTRAELTELARKVASELGGDWRATGYAQRGWGVDVSSTDGEIVNLATNWQRPGRVSAESIYPVTTRTTARIEISIAIARGAGQIAKDIARRLLPAYRAELAAVADYEQTEAASHAARAAVMAEVERMFGQQPHPHDPYEPGRTGRERYAMTTRLPLRGHPRGRYQGGTVEANGHGDALDLDLTGIPREVALRMLRVLAGFNAAVREAGEEVNG